MLYILGVMPVGPRVDRAWVRSGSDMTLSEWTRVEPEVAGSFRSCNRAVGRGLVRGWSEGDEEVVRGN